MIRLPWLFRRKNREFDCHDVRDLASDYVEQDLDEATVSRLQRHLEGCGPWHKFVSTFTKTLNFLRGMPQEETPEEVKARILAKIREH